MSQTHHYKIKKQKRKINLRVEPPIIIVVITVKMVAMTINESSTMLDDLPGVSRLTRSSSTCGKYYYYHLFTDKKSAAQRLTIL